MKSRWNCLVIVMLGLCAAPVAQAQLPPNFIDEVISDDFDFPVGLTFAPDGRMFVWQKGGRLYFIEPGGSTPVLLLDIGEEVGDWRDYGMLGFALDPQFYSNGRIYVSYVVDFHYLQYFGTPQYDPQADEYFRDTIGRVTRYTCNIADGCRSILPGSRTILLGESMTTGIPILHQSHGVGSLMFGADGTLLVTCGEGASYDLADTGGPIGGSSNTGLADGIIQPKEDVGALRSQMIDSLSGKILRVDPNTGDGLPSNPFFNPAEPRAARSRVWALGLRNPYRCVIRSGTGSADPSDADPGSIYIGDVGWADWEELSVCTAGGQNFGWPLYEGLETSDYYGMFVENADAPNPLAGQGGCGSHFRFEDLLIQDTPAPSWPNSCDAGQQIPASTPRFMHRRPALDFFHQVSQGPARVGIFTAGVADEIGIDDPASPVPGPNFGGNASVAGAWYTGTAFPLMYHSTFFHTDYAHGWIRNCVFDASDNLLEVRNFATDRGFVLGMAAHPLDGALYYANLSNQGVFAVRRIRYVDNLPPIVVASPTVAYGPAPLTVSFGSTGTFDPESGPLQYLWQFGDGSLPSFEPNPTHTYSIHPWVDITDAGTIVGRVWEIDPSGPLGGGDPEVIRDGDYPPIGSVDSSRQFETYHDGDQGSFDWIGYDFGQPHEMRGLLFQEGKHNWNGGWFDSLGVDVLVGGQWQPVSDLVISPGYPGNNGPELAFEPFTLRFTPVVATAIRISGQPGGLHTYISIGELRALAASAAPLTGPARYDVQLTVTDELRNAVTRELLVSVNNTPPSMQIVSPLNLSTYSMAGQSFVPLSASISDAEHGPGELECAWSVVLHHDEHVHPEPLDPQCETEAVVDPHGICGAETFFYSMGLTVTDAAGLSVSGEVRIYPACCATNECAGVDLSIPPDCVVDLSDLTTLLSNFGNLGVNLPGDIQPPFGVVDLTDLTTFLAHFGANCQ